MKSINLAAIDLNLLVAFESLMEERSVTGAAQRLNLGQPAMSAALSRLRTLFEDELFIRMGRQMQPTHKALVIAPGILTALNQIRQTVESSQTFDPSISTHSFAIGSSDYTSFVLVPNLLALSQQVAPHLNFRMIGFEKDSVGDLLEQGTIDLALGVFPNPPRQTQCMPLFEERFVGIARRGHPAIANGSIALEMFVTFPHALVTLRRDETGEIDKVLARYNLQRRIALTIPYVLVLPFIISSSDLLSAVPYRMALQFARLSSLDIFELPIKAEPWTVSMMWSKLAEKDNANSWLREMLETVCSQI